MKLLTLLFLTVLTVIIVLVHGWGGGKECNVKPFRLLYNNSDKTIALDEDALKFLRSRGDKTITVIIVFGPFRTGKSFFCNSITQCPNLFHVEAGHNPVTKGAWAFPMEDDDNLTLVVDMEGLDFPGSKRDKPLVRFSVFAASHLVYHLARTIGETDIERLSAAVKLRENVERVKNVILPQTTWVVEQDSLSDDEKKEQEMLEKLKVGNDFVFKDLDQVIYIPPPVNDSTDWKKLNSIDFKELKDDYRAEIEKVRKILINASKKELTTYSGPITCNRYADYLESIVLTANRNDLDYSDYLKSIINESIFVGVKNYTDSMSLYELPMSTSDLYEAHRNVSGIALGVFKHNLFTHVASDELFRRSEKSFNDSVNEKFDHFLKANTNASREYCQGILRSFEDWFKTKCNSLSDAYRRKDDEERNLIGPKEITDEYVKKMKDLIENTKNDPPPKGPTPIQFLAMILVGCIAIIATHRRFGEEMKTVPVLDFVMPVLYYMSWVLSVAIVVGLCMGIQDDLFHFIWTPSYLHYSLVGVMTIGISISLAIFVLKKMGKITEIVRV